MENKTLSKRVKSLRTRKGFSQEQLAEESGLSLRTIQRIENGETQSTGATLKLLAEALSVQAEELLDWGLEEDTDYLVALNLTALTFFVFPILGILIPSIMWVAKKDKLKGLNEVASSLINFQITWSILLFSIPISLLLLIGGLGVQVSMSVVILVGLIVIGGMCIYNLTVILVNTSRIRKEQSVKYRPAIRFVKG